ncbi:unnamed protein product [Strongylus vulgaris]|uniref:Uncharacterized protein n=1 Tax=Strongylus vulgaris TaxID=40348 RepID=A0A3P7LEQ3_STRVU|nr:unnamed protein product [Strongylus vulgaris]
MNLPFTQAQRTNFEEMLRQCYETYKVSNGVRRMIQWCFKSRHGFDLQVEASKITTLATCFRESGSLSKKRSFILGSAWPDRHKYVPWFILNGVSLERLQPKTATLAEHLCKW